MTRTLASKVCQGLQEQGCNVYGRGSIASAMKPLEAYVQKVIQREVLAERKRCLGWCAAYASDDGTAQAIADGIRGMK